MLLLKNVLV